MKGIGKRIQVSRERAGLTQYEAARRLGFKDRRTLAAIETGTRALSDEELVMVCKVLGVSALRLLNEGIFTWHTASEQPNALIQRLSERAGNYLAMYRVLQKESIKALPLEPRLVLEGQGTLQQISEIAKALLREWSLKQVPADQLETAVSKHLPFMLIRMDLPKEVLSGSCRLARFSAIFLNRTLSYERSAIELARQCFTLLTREQLRYAPQHAQDKAIKGKGDLKHTERLVRHFLNEILLPESGFLERTLQRFESDEAAAIRFLIKHFELPADFVVDRLIGLGLISLSHRARILKRCPKEEPIEGRKSFNKEIAHALLRGILEGEISEKRAAALLDLSLEGLMTLFKNYQLDSTRI